MQEAVLESVKKALEKDPPRYDKTGEKKGHFNGARIGYVSNFGKPIVFHVEFNKTNHRLAMSIHGNMEGLSAAKITEMIMADEYARHARFRKVADLEDAIRPRRGRPTDGTTGPKSSAERAADHRRKKKEDQETVAGFFEKFFYTEMCDDTKIQILKDRADNLDTTYYGKLLEEAKRPKPQQTDIEKLTK
ncbi:MAG: hypothetical protein ABJL55_17110 [Roseibium sp.]